MTECFLDVATMPQVNNCLQVAGLQTSTVTTFRKNPLKRIYSCEVGPDRTMNWSRSGSRSAICRCLLDVALWQMNTHKTEQGHLLFKSLAILKLPRVHLNKLSQYSQMIEHKHKNTNKHLYLLSFPGEYSRSLNVHLYWAYYF